MKTAGSNDGIVRCGNEGIHELLVGESSRPGRGVLVDGVCAKCVDGQNDEVSDAGEDVVGGRGAGSASCCATAVVVYAVVRMGQCECRLNS